MARERTTPWTTKPGGPEFRLERVDGRATVDVGLSKRFGQRLGPGFRSEKWGGRGWLEIRGHGVELNRPGEIKSHPKYGDVYECECTRMARGRKRGERHLIIPGSTEYQIEWDTKDDVPEEGYVDFLLDFSGDLVWHKQLPLTQEEIDAGSHRPDEAVNSYAIYGSREGRILRSDGSEFVNYENGKFCHLYRPQLIDANGNSLWCDQTAPLAGPNRLRVYLDRDWLSGATYPVTLDPTLGYTSLGASDFNTSTSYVTFTQLGSMPVTGTTTSLHIGASSSLAVNATLGLYADNGSNLPGLKVVDTGEVSVSTKAWYSSNTDSAAALTASAYYWLAFTCASTYGPKLWYDSGGRSEYRGSYTYVAGTVNLADAQPTSSGWQTWKFSAYLTYVAASVVKGKIIGGGIL